MPTSNRRNDLLSEAHAKGRQGSKETICKCQRAKCLQLSTAKRFSPTFQRARSRHQTVWVDGMSVVVAPALLAEVASGSPLSHLEIARGCCHSGRLGVSYFNVPPTTIGSPSKSIASIVTSPLSQTTVPVPIALISTLPLGTVSLSGAGLWPWYAATYVPVPGGANSHPASFP